MPCQCGCCGTTSTNDAPELIKAMNHETIPLYFRFVMVDNKITSLVIIPRKNQTRTTSAFFTRLTDTRNQGVQNQVERNPVVVVGGAPDVQKLPLDCLKCIAKWVDLLDLLNLVRVSWGFNRAFSNENLWRDILEDFCLENQIDHHMVQVALPDFGQSYFKMAKNTGLIDKKAVELFFDTFKENSTEKHYIITFIVPGSRLPRTILMHPDENCISCLSHQIPYVSQIYTISDKERILFDPFVPIQDEFTVDLETTFPLYLEFLREIDFWDKYNNCFQETKIQQLLRVTEKYMIEFLKSENQINVLPDLVMLGLHYFCLQTEPFYKWCYSNYGKLPSIDYGQLLINRKNPEYQQELLELNNKAKIDVKGKKSYSFAWTLISPENIFASIQDLVEKTKDSNRTAKEILSTYQTFVGEASKKAKQQCEDPMVDLIYHLHLMSPSKFRLDSFAFYKKIVHHQPYDGGYTVYSTIIDDRKLVLSLNIKEKRLYLSEPKGRIKPHQKWVNLQAGQLKWFDPVSMRYYDIIVSKKIKSYSYTVENGPRFVRTGPVVSYRKPDWYAHTGEPVMFVFSSDGMTLDIVAKFTPNYKLRFLQHISK